jgi:hypothetical protein
MLARAVVQQLVIDAVALKEDQDQGAIALAEAQEAAAQAYAAKVHHLQPVITSMLSFVSSVQLYPTIECSGQLRC